ncbi:hypothetical protein [Enterovirga rhinocerotis]|uniref:Uncharacterized protein n=1 Tax=Enterovirga rhinocerotis TaxID=1339210 RepID=A0A4R7BWA6_9HYPH|nr:hypothetical protein [Enterovirga rhinocerotis]TDR90178.1 hypothetical protein EV668_3020 [Enterovirga rhinocerotis]
MRSEADDPNATDGVIPPSRALVRFERRSAPRGGSPAQADFLAQLIACRSRVGAYRDRRRGAPEHALTCYRREPRATASELDLTV